MNKTQLLLLSASREGDTPYLSHALPLMHRFLEHADLSQAVFVPYAGVTLSYDEYTHKVNQALAPLKIQCKGLHTFADPVAAIYHASVILIGGGNTFMLLDQLYQKGVLTPIRQAVANGIPYIGWSAGSNVAGKTICTTNDMPIIQPESFTALKLANVQLNPHYSEWTQPGHNGETRLDRLAEYLVVNPEERVLALPEGTALEQKGDKVHIRGNKDAYWITAPAHKTPIAPNHPLSF